MEDESDDDGSLGDFSVENYTIDLAELARRASGKIGVLGQHADGGRQGEEGVEDEDGREEEQEEGDEGDVLSGFEVDLGALGEKPSGVVVEDRVEQRDEVASEADGPEDFTLNMGAWMREAKEFVKEGDVPSDVDEQKKTELRREKIDGAFGIRDEQSILDPISTSTPAPKLARAGNDIQRPSTARGTTELVQDQAAEEVFQKISALQAEVERMREAEERRRAAYKQLQEENREMKERQGHSSNTSKELASLKVEAERERMASEEKIQTLGAGLKASHATVRQLRQEMEEDEQMQNNKIEGLNEDMERLRADLDNKNGQLAEIEQDAETQNEIVAHRDQLIERLTTEAEIIRKELEAAKDEAKESRRISELVQQENDGLMNNQTQEDQEQLIAMKTALQSKARELDAAHGVIASLKEKPDLDFVEMQEPAAAISESSHQAALDALKQEHASALSALNQKFAHQLQLFKKDRDAQASKHAAELAKSKDTPPAPTAMETELRSAIRVLSSKLEKAHAATRTARSETETAQAELEQDSRAAEMARKDNELVNQALEARFAEAVEAREREWRRRVAVLFKERETMGKAMMAGWGREEVGVDVKGSDGGQGYRYRYMKR